MNRRKFWAIASCANPPKSKATLIEEVVPLLGSYGYHPRAGGEGGLEASVVSAAPEEYRADIFLPWDGYNDNETGSFEIRQGASCLVRAIHPKPDKLSRGALRLHGRRVHQLLGRGLNAPVSFLVLWFPTSARREPNGLDLLERMAALTDTPVLNLADPEYVSGWGSKKLLKRLLTLAGEGACSSEDQRS